MKTEGERRQPARATGCLRDDGNLVLRKRHVEPVARLLLGLVAFIAGVADAGHVGLSHAPKKRLRGEFSENEKDREWSLPALKHADICALGHAVPFVSAKGADGRADRVGEAVAAPGAMGQAGGSSLCRTESEVSVSLDGDP